MADLKQYGVLVVGLLMAGGFAFGGMLSYAGLINTSSPDKQKVKAVLPEDNFKKGSYNLSVKQRMALTVKKDVVFVTAIYNTTKQKQELLGLKQLVNKFNNRIYIEVVDASESQLADRYSISSYPRVIMLGYKTSIRRGATGVQGNITQQKVASTACSIMQNWNGIASYCSTV